MRCVILDTAVLISSRWVAVGTPLGVPSYDSATSHCPSGEVPPGTPVIVAGGSWKAPGSCIALRVIPVSGSVSTSELPVIEKRCFQSPDGTPSGRLRSEAWERESMTETTGELCEDTASYSL